MSAILAGIAQPPAHNRSSLLTAKAAAISDMHPCRHAWPRTKQHLREPENAKKNPAEAGFV